MKKIIFFLLFIPVLAQAQGYPIQTAQGSNNQLTFHNGSYGALKGFVYKGTYADTAVANLSYIKNVPGQTIRTIDDKLWMRSNDIQRWISLGGSATDYILNQYATRQNASAWINSFRTDSTLENYTPPYTVTDAANAGNYGYSSSKGVSLEDLSGLSSIFTLPADDPFSPTIDLPFTFRYCKVDYTQIIISANGYIALGTSTTSQYVLKPYRMDWYFQTDGAVRYKTFGIAPNRKFVVEWYQGEWFNARATPERITVQCWINEGSGIVQYVFGPHISNSGTAANVGDISVNDVTTRIGVDSSGDISPNVVNSVFPIEGQIFSFNPNGTVIPTYFKVKDKGLSIKSPNLNYDYLSNIMGLNGTLNVAQGSLNITTTGTPYDWNAITLKSTAPPSSANRYQTVRMVWLNYDGSLRTQMAQLPDSSIYSAYPVFILDAFSSGLTISARRNDMKFDYNGSTAFMLKGSSRNFLINTTTDDGVNKLQVNGGIYGKSLGKVVRFDDGTQWGNQLVFDQTDVNLPRYNLYLEDPAKTTWANIYASLGEIDIEGGRPNYGKSSINLSNGYLNLFSEKAAIGLDAPKYEIYNLNTTSIGRPLYIRGDSLYLGTAGTTAQTLYNSNGSLRDSTRRVDITKGSLEFASSPWSNLYLNFKDSLNPRISLDMENRALPNTYGILDIQPRKAYLTVNDDAYKPGAWGGLVIQSGASELTGTERIELISQKYLIDNLNSTSTGRPLMIRGDSLYVGPPSLNDVINLAVSVAPKNSADPRGVEGDLKRDAKGNLYLKTARGWRKFTGKSF